MGFYSHYIFPWILEFSLNRPHIKKLRRELLSQAHGKTLEIGSGTGLNLACYPSSLKDLTAIDNNPATRRWFQRRVKRAKIRVDHQILRGKKLPFPEETFETVVTTFTLCSIQNITQALREIHRVLKPTGKFLFLEHGLSPDSKVALWQRRLTPFQKIFGDGCHLDRNIVELLGSASFSLEDLKTFYLPKTPKIMGYFYQGIGIKS
jgi:ubiquinone/menaquinone biosynthesis C-methylase UbiE